MTHRGIHVDVRQSFVPEPGPAPMLMWLPVEKLIIDEAYAKPKARARLLALPAPKVQP